MCDVRSTMNARGGGGPDAAFVAGSSQCGASPGSPHENFNALDFVTRRKARSTPNLAFWLE